MPNHDVIVVGGGPGGSTSATLLAKTGARVLLVDRKRFPRYQIGESLLPATVHGVCALLGVSEDIHAAGFVRKRGGTFRWGASPTPWTFDFGNSPVNQSLEFNYAYQVERAKFDEILLRNAQRNGVEVREGVAVVGALQEEGRVIGVELTDDSGGRSTAHARFVVDASGNQSRLHRYAGERVYSSFFQNVALFGYFEDAGRLPEPNEGNIFSCTFPYGWFWYIPLSPTLTSVGAVISKQHADRLRAGPERAMAEMIAACPEIRDLLATARRVDHGIYGRYRVRKDYSYTSSRFWAPGLVLVGDAACFVDPVFSSGVHLATYSGMLAARTIATILSGDMEEDVGSALYEERYRSEFSVFFDFLISFYDMHKDEDSYFWRARKILGGAGPADDAFLQLVAGAGTTVPEFLRLRERSGDLFQLRVESTVDPGKRPALFEALLKELDVSQVHLRAVSRQVSVASPDGLDRELEFHRAGDPAARLGYRASDDGLHWEPVAGSTSP